eukprot:Sspe_Gene.28345::Locus_12786_Transcript_1_1_Confidence_1.000_Length_1448::g.28345::m.28345
MNEAKYYKDGEVVHVPGKELWANAVEMDVDGFDKPFSGVPNRDSTQYKEIYNLPDIKTLLRGTFRYSDCWAPIILALVKLGLLDLTEREFKGSYMDLMVQQSGAKSKDEVKKAIAEKCGCEEDGKVIKAFEWLGLFSDDAVTAKTYLDAVCARRWRRKRWSTPRGRRT